MKCIETYIVFTVEYRTGKFVKLKVFKLMLVSSGHEYNLSDVIQSVVSHVSQNFNNITIPEIIKFIQNNIENSVAVEVVGDGEASVGFTVYFSSDDLTSD